MITEERLGNLEHKPTAAKRRNRPLIVLGIVIGALTAIIILLVADLHVYRVTSGYSGQQYWLAFSQEPTEDEFLDAIIYRDPLISEPYQTTQDWRKLRQENHRLCLKKDNYTSIVVMPFELEKDPDTVLQDGTVIKGVWLTEPNKRTEFPVAGVGLGIVLGSFLVATIATICALTLLRWLWHFLGALAAKRGLLTFLRRHIDKTVLWAGVGIIIVMCLFPPWTTMRDHLSDGYHCLLYESRGSTIDTTRLILQCAIVALLTGCLLWTVGKSKKA
jgi:hypothetical protein